MEDNNDSHVSLQEKIRVALEQSQSQESFRHVETLVKENPQACAAHVLYNYQNQSKCETLLSLALLYQAPLSTIQSIYKVHPASLLAVNEFGMTPFHQACTVPTCLETLEFLVLQLKQKHSKRLADLPAPQGWTCLHVACRVGSLPVDSFQFLIKHFKPKLASSTENSASTPLHLALFGLDNRRSQLDQRLILQQLVRAFPFTVNAKNTAGNTPVIIAKNLQKATAGTGHLDSDMVELLADVQALLKPTYCTRVEIEQRIQACQSVLGNGQDFSELQQASSSQDFGVTNDQSSRSTMSSYSSSQLITLQKGSADDRIKALRLETLAHVELEILQAMKLKFPTIEQLRESMNAITIKLQAIVPEPSNFDQREVLTQKLKELEEKLKRELNAMIPHDIRQTQLALITRLRSNTHMPPYNQVSLEYLDEATNHFCKSNRIGQGGFGAVFRAYDTTMCVQYAVKTTDKENDMTLEQEIKILSQVSHPNITRVLGQYIPPGSSSPTHLVFEYAGGGTLTDCLSSPEARKGFDWSQRLTAAVGVASALNYLHNGMQQPVGHHDVKPDNIVFPETKDRPILIDCGIAKILKEHQHSADFTKTNAGTPLYLPKDYGEDTPYDEKTEVFSFGLVLKVMLTGTIPKSYGDRDRLMADQIPPDPLAGEWPPTVLEEYKKISNDCVQSAPKDRPTIQLVYQKLLDLSNKNDREIKVSALEQKKLDQQLEKTRLISRKSKHLKATDCCDCSPKEEKEGLKCPGGLHFQCSECFNKHVVDYLGEEIYCAQTSCPCKDPYTLDELMEHLGKRVFLKHMRLIKANGEPNIRRDELREILREEFDKWGGRIMGGIKAIGRNELSCPMLALLIPVESSGKRSILSRALRSWKNTTTRTFFLYFVCAYDNSLVLEAPIKVETQKEWVKLALPYLRAAIIGLSIAVMASGIPISLPMVDMAADPAKDEIVRNLVVLDKFLVEMVEANEESDQHARDLYNALMGKEIGDKMSFESYKLVAELAHQEGNTKWRNCMDLAERNGEIAWVKKENKFSYENGIPHRPHLSHN